MKILFALTTLTFISFAYWFWVATEPESVVGKLDVKVGPGWDTVYKQNIGNKKLFIGYRTYKLCLIDGHGQHIEVDVSPSDFKKAKFDEWDAFEVCRIRKHYEVSLE